MEVLAVAEKPRRAMTLLEFVVVLVIIGGLVAVLIPAVRAARRAARRAQRRNNLVQIGLGFHNFHDVYKQLPPAVRRDELGRPLCSWRFHLLPYLEAWMTPLDFGERWDEPINRWATNGPLHVYCLYPNRDRPECLHTNVVAIVGPGTAFEEGQELGLEDLDSDTVLAVEIAGFDVHWAEPGDLHVHEVPESITAGPEGGGLCVLFADGAVWFLKSEVPLENLRKFFTIESAKQHDREELLAPYANRR
jgi:hypothetical protein